MYTSKEIIVFINRFSWIILITNSVLDLNLTLRSLNLIPCCLSSKENKIRSTKNRGKKN